MKEFKPNKLCHCGGKESCEICRPKIQKRRLRKRYSQKIKKLLKGLRNEQKR